MFSTEVIATGLLFSKKRAVSPDQAKTTFVLSHKGHPFFEFFWEDGHFWYRVTMQYWGYTHPRELGYNFDFERWNALSRILEKRTPDSATDEACFTEIRNVLKTLPDGLPF